MKEMFMKIDRTVKTLLLVIAVLLAVNVFRPFVATPTVEAQGGEAYPFYIEPGVTMLRAPDGSRQVYGKVVVDLRNGKVWGFPTMAQDVPYPMDQVNPGAPTSHPFLLAKYAFSDTDR
jgi:hypothetical protein